MDSAACHLSKAGWGGLAFTRWMRMMQEDFRSGLEHRKMNLLMRWGAYQKMPQKMVFRMLARRLAGAIFSIEDIRACVLSACPNMASVERSGILSLWWLALATSAFWQTGALHAKRLWTGTGQA
jgi:hypothetical protein